MLKKLFIYGQIPYLHIIKPILYWLAWISPLSIFFLSSAFANFAEIAWIIFITVLAIRPLADIFPGFRILRTLTSLRREFGVFSGMMFVAHFIGFLIARDINLLDIFQNSFYWAWDGIYLWGILGIILIAIVLSTSNFSAMKLLKNRWKTLQHLSYLVLFLGGTHIILLGENSGWIGILIVTPLWLLAKFKVKVPLFT